MTQSHFRLILAFRFLEKSVGASGAFGKTFRTSISPASLPPWHSHSTKHFELALHHTQTYICTFVFFFYSHSRCPVHIDFFLTLSPFQQEASVCFCGVDTGVFHSVNMLLTCHFLPSTRAGLGQQKYLSFSHLTFSLCLCVFHFVWCSLVSYNLLVGWLAGLVCWPVLLGSQVGIRIGKGDLDLGHQRDWEWI